MLHDTHWSALLALAGLKRYQDFRLVPEPF